MTRKQIDKTNVLRFRLVQKSVRDQRAGGEDSGERTYVPVNEASARQLEAWGMSALQERRGDEPPPETDPSLDAPVDVKVAAGEAAKYGIFYDDRVYDYTKHLKTIGEVPGAVFIPATPLGDVSAAEPAVGNEDEDEASALNHANYDNLHERDDLDPLVKECLVALEDEAYEDEDGFEDDFVLKLNREEETAVLAPVNRAAARQLGGARRSHGVSLARHGSTKEEEDDDDDDDMVSVASDVSSYRGTSYAASLAITSIDSKFEALMRIYDDEEDELDDVEFSDDEHSSTRGDADRAAVQEALDDFLAHQNDYVRPTMAERKQKAVEVLGELRRQMGPIPDSYLNREMTDSDNVNDEDSWSSSESDELDCQSAATTLATVENLPTLIREQSRAKKPDIIRLSRRTGMPIISEDCSSRQLQHTEEEEQPAQPLENKGQPRPKEETAEEKRARKAAVKSERRERRAQKKDLKVRFKLEESEGVPLKSRVQNK